MVKIQEIQTQERHNRINYGGLKFKKNKRIWEMPKFIFEEKNKVLKVKE